ncbi:MAG: damage-inducible protein DinB [Anaerolineae bacterium]|nr:damage-inducible protein DinB [Gemmatimonadaceae bacterium]
MIQHIRKLFDHVYWADAKVLESLRAMPDPPAKALEIFSHVLGAEHIWLARLRQQQARVAVWPTLSIQECAALAQENKLGYDSFIETLDSDSLRQEVGYTNSAGLTFRSTGEDILLHVAVHGAYHRGQVALVVRNSGTAPAATDYIAFVRGAPAATRQRVESESS